MIFTRKITQEKKYASSFQKKWFNVDTFTKRDRCLADRRRWGCMGEFRDAKFFYSVANNSQEAKSLNESEDEQVKTQVSICITFSLQAQLGRI
jgi:hypothetical protein